MRPKLSIIIVNYRSDDVLEHCLRSLHNATSEHLEIILVDNSPDGQAKDVLRQSGIHGHYFPQAENISYTRAANLGAQHASGEFLCFLNPDMILAGRSLDRLVAWAEQHPRAVAGPRERNQAGGIVTTAFPFVTRRSLWGTNTLYKIPWPRSWHLGLSWLIPSYTYAELCRTTAEPERVPVLTGSCQLMSRRTWDEVGEWNIELTYFGLESEWFQRAYNEGVFGWYIPGAEVYHEHAVSINRAPRREVRQEAQRNRRWHARRFGFMTIAILLIIFWLEEKFRPSAMKST